MSKIILQFPYAIKKDRQKELFDKYKKQWDDGLLVIDGTVMVSVMKDEDVLVLQLNKDEPEGGCKWLKFL